MILNGRAPAIHGMRREYKYTISHERARAIAEWIRPYCVPDRYLDEGATSYVISTLYLDSPELRLYWEKKTIQFARVKVRVRTYGEKAEGPVFLELKRRYGDVVVKARGRVPRRRWREVLTPGGGEAVASWPLSPHVRAVVEDFRSHTEMLRLRPLLVVRYDREPYVGLLTPQVRVTFDRGLRYAPMSEATIPGGDRAYRFMDFAQSFGAERSEVVLELKFDGHPPEWMRDLVARFDLLRGSFSKYGTAVDAMHDERVVLSPGWLASTLG